VHLSRKHEPPGYLTAEFVPDIEKVEVIIESRWEASYDEHYRARGTISEREFDEFVAGLERQLDEPFTDPTMTGSETGIAYYFPLDNGVVTGAASTMLDGPPPHVIIADFLVFLEELLGRPGFAVVRPLNPDLTSEELDDLAESNPSTFQRVLPWIVLALGLLVAVAAVALLLIRLDGPPP